ncbi:type I secretion system permease/ATPase [Pontivivens ytuae]|uniref:Type I secretion system permease/ATPase n=1 Tax=Pontivivens ytuae TaxID=2789856 RepID=A0A7S9LRV2_9RHOB|nr:type I secretion system permease/ATPase [Pontivivens ytuae]QPH54144.1 type I secretion system permease/ATPase [Pontivivens ytuae]
MSDRANLSPLEACLIFAAREQGLAASLAHLRSHEMGLKAAADLDDIARAAEDLGFVTALAQLKVARLTDDMLPAILLGEHGAAVLVLARRGNRFTVFDPALSDRDAVHVKRAALAASHDGRALFLHPRADTDGSPQAPAKGHWFWSTLAESRWAYTQVVLAAAISSVLGLATSIFIMVVYDRVLPNEATESLVALTVGIGVALLFDFLIKSLRASFIDRAGQRADLVMGRRIFERILGVQMKTPRGSTGALASTMREFETLRDFITSATLVGVVDLPFIALFILVISLIGGPLAIVPAIAVPLVLLVGIAVQPILARVADRSHSEGQNKQSVLVETLSGLETIKTVGATRVMRRRWEGALARQSDHALRSRAVSQFALNATAFTQQAAQVMIVFYGVFLIQAGAVSMGALIACVILTGRTLAPLAQLAQTMTRASQARASYRAINALMQMPVEGDAGRSWLSRPRLSPSITFRNVSFTYPGQKEPCLSDVSFEIAPGERVAILGRIGSGKSTVGRLIAGLYPPGQGHVLVDGTDISHIHPVDLRNNIGTVLQDVWLFSGTVRENIAVGAERPGDEEIVEAAKAAGIHDFLARHPMGYDLEVSERGGALSGGQRQAIALARALIGRKPLLLLDEPTSAMDVQSERAFVKRLAGLERDRTLLLVTHRTALLDAVDRVIVLDGGRVALDGPKALLHGTAANDRPRPKVVSSDR